MKVTFVICQMKIKLNLNISKQNTLKKRKCWKKVSGFISFIADQEEECESSEVFSDIQEDSECDSNFENKEVYYFLTLEKVNNIFPLVHAE